MSAIKLLETRFETTILAMTFSAQVSFQQAHFSWSKHMGAKIEIFLREPVAIAGLPPRAAERQRRALEITPPATLRRR
ncbi:hypothetical protein [Aquamicrobium terrae]